jgi:hypothetical protein
VHGSSPKIWNLWCSTIPNDCQNWKKLLKLRTLIWDQIEHTAGNIGENFFFCGGTLGILMDLRNYGRRLMFESD